MFKAGQLVIITFSKAHYTNDGFATGRITENNKFCIFDRINLHTYPSCRDFLGKFTKVDEGELATISRYVGRPLRIKPELEFDHYNVYEIIVQGSIKQIFEFNLETWSTQAPQTELG